MLEPAQLAGHLLRLEQQLQAYEKLHPEERAELWAALKACQAGIVALADEAVENTCSAANGQSIYPKGKGGAVEEETLTHTSAAQPSRGRIGLCRYRNRR